MAKINYAEGIHISDIQNNNLTNLEVEVMSQDLPKIFDIEVSGVIKHGASLNLIPPKRNISISDVLCSGYNWDFNWCIFRDYKICTLKLNDIPEEYNYFNILLNCFDYKKITDFKMIISDSSGIIMNFQSFSIEPMIVFHLGVLAKTDNEMWKLYPRFKGYEKDFNTLLNDKNSFLYL